MKKIILPENFLFGASTASHQVEGGNFNNDWWQFEKQGKIKDGSSAKIACDHYRLYKEDFGLAQNLGHNAHRLSIEWSRIQPKPDFWSQKETHHYRQVLQTLRKLNLASFVTLHHFTNPLWFAKIGGWSNPKSPDIFSKYVDYCVQNFGDLIDFWLTINEPQIVTGCGYLIGTFPPGKRNPILALKVAQNLVKAHQNAYQVIHRLRPQAKVSFASQQSYIEPKWLQFFPDWFLNKTRNYLDFIGLNFYHYFSLKNFHFIDKDPTRGLYLRLQLLKKYHLPIYITENGTAGSDQERGQLIANNLRIIQKAIKNGVDVRGYLHWTLMDNFEWFSGTSCRMGLCETNFKTLKRTPRPSAYLFKDLILRYQKG